MPLTIRKPPLRPNRGPSGGCGSEQRPSILRPLLPGALLPYPLVGEPFLQEGNDLFVWFDDGYGFQDD